ALNFAVDDPPLHRKIKLFFMHLDNMRDAITPLGFGHPARVGILIELSVRIGANQAILNFHGFFSKFRRSSKSYLPRPNELLSFRPTGEILDPSRPFGMTTPNRAQ